MAQMAKKGAGKATILILSGGFGGLIAAGKTAKSQPGNQK